jgi:MerR family mercuric resistance operon transcriptional regulator
MYGVQDDGMSVNGLTIGELANAAGVGVETVRFYERQRLLERPSTPDRGYRRYPGETVHRIAFIRRAKALGFALAEIRDLLDLRSRRGAPCPAGRDRAIAKRNAIDEKICELQKLRSAVDVLLEVCTGRVAVDQCSIVGALEGVTDTAEARVFRNGEGRKS